MNFDQIGNLFHLNRNVERLLVPTLVAVGATSLLLILRTFLLKYVEKWTKRTSSKLDDLMVDVIRTPSFFWCFALGLYAGLTFSELPAKIANPLFEVVHISLIFSATLAVSNLAVAAYRQFMKANAQVTGTSGLAVGLLRSLINGLGLLLIFSVLGIDVRPFLAAVGVGGLAIALALKDTLENLFAGIYLITDRTIRVGDYIKLETGHEGMVEDIGWRTTRIFLTSNSTVILPNSKLSQSIVTNYSLPENRVLLTIPISVSTDSNIEAVENAVYEAINEEGKNIPGLLFEPRAVVRTALKSPDSSLDFNLFVNVRHFSEQGIVQHELRKAILKKFEEKKIAKPQSTLQIVGYPQLHN